MDKESVLTQLKWSIQAMACDSETQISLFPNFIVVSEEIIADFNHWKRIVSPYKSGFSPGQIESLHQIDTVIEEITGYEEEIWDNNSLVTHELWGELRIAGADALKEFNWNLETPATSRSIFL